MHSKTAAFLPSSLPLFLFSSLSLFSLFLSSLVAQVYFLAAQRSLHLLRVVCLRRKKKEAYAHTKRNIKSARRDDLFVKAMKRGRGTLEDAENTRRRGSIPRGNFAEGEQEQEQEENERSKHRASRTKTTTTTERFAAIKGSSSSLKGRKTGGKGGSGIHRSVEWEDFTQRRQVARNCFARFEQRINRLITERIERDGIKLEASDVFYVHTKGRVQRSKRKTSALSLF